MDSIFSPLPAGVTTHRATFHSHFGVKISNLNLLVTEIRTC